MVKSNQWSKELQHNSQSTNLKGKDDTDLRSSTPSASTQPDHARPDLNSPQRNDEHIPDMNEGTDHLAATSAGTLGGAALGAALGIAGGPPGAIVGGAIGGVIGGVAGNDIAQGDKTSTGDAHWNEHYQHTPYYREANQLNKELNYERDYRVAYQLGERYAMEYGTETKFHEVANDLERQWSQVKGESRLDWNQAELAMQDAWNRVRESSSK